MIVEAEGDAGGMEQAGVLQGGGPVHHAGAQLAGRGVHALIPAHAGAWRAPQLVQIAAYGLGLGRPDNVIGVYALFAGDVAHGPAIGVVGHAGDERGRDAQAAQPHGEGILAARHGQAHQPRALDTLVVGRRVAHHHFTKGHECRTPALEWRQVVCQDV